MTAKELARMENPYEQGDHESLREVDFYNLQEQDEVILATSSGSIYKLSIKAAVEGEVKATLSRRNDRSVKGEIDSWEAVEESALFDLRGCCKNCYVHGESLMPSEETWGHFVIGERAWLVTVVDDDEKTLLTSKVQQIQLNQTHP